MATQVRRSKRIRRWLHKPPPDSGDRYRMEPGGGLIAVHDVKKSRYRCAILEQTCTPVLDGDSRLRKIRSRGSRWLRTATSVDSEYCRNPPGLVGEPAELSDIWVVLVVDHFVGETDLQQRRKILVRPHRFLVDVLRGLDVVIVRPFVPHDLRPMLL